MIEKERAWEEKGPSKIQLQQTKKKKANVFFCFPPFPSTTTTPETLPSVTQVDAYLFGSVPLKTYLPDGDIDVSLVQVSGPSIRDSWAPRLAAALEAGADIVGANCGTDLSLDDYVDLAKELKAAAGTAPAILQPNAGAPKNTPDGIRYDATPEEMAAAALRLREAGISIIGGCCGTTPAHLAAMARALS